MDSVGKIGVIMPIVQDYLDSEFLQGIQDMAFSLGYDVLVFTNMANLQATTGENDYVRGENNIYSLIDTIELDGIILAASKFLSDTFVDELIEKLNSLSIPSIVIGKEQGILPYIYASEADCFYELTKHIIEVHHAKRCYCLTGPKGIRQSEERLSGFQKAVREANLLHKNVRFFYGDFWKFKAEEIAEKIISGEIEMPDAVICGNDSMAITLCEKLQANEINVPEDIIITGFDGHILALTHTPSITTVSGIERQLGGRAVNEIYRLIKGFPSPFHEDCYQLQFGESCGCKQSKDVKLRINHILSNTNNYINTIYQTYVTSNYIMRLSESKSFEELITTIKDLSYLMLSWKWLDIALCEDWMRDNDKFRTKGYSEKMILAVSKRYGYDDETDSYLFPLKQILPALHKLHTPKFIILTPLHCSLQVLGYCASAYENASDFKCDYFYNNWCDAVSNGLYSLQAKLYADKIKEKIEMYSERDMFTGMLNIKGFTKVLPKFLNRPKTKCGMLILLNVKVESDSSCDDILPFVNAIQYSRRLGEVIARLGNTVFAVIIPIEDVGQTETEFDKWMIYFDKALKDLHKKTKCIIPRYVSISGILKYSDEFNWEESINEMLRNLLKKTNSNSEKEYDYSSQLKIIHQEIKMKPQFDWSIPYIASKLNISVSYLAKIYKKQFGCTLIDEIINARITKAKQLLKQTNYSVCEIADKCGYPNSSSFMRQFKQKTGMTAKEYRGSVK